MDPIITLKGLVGSLVYSFIGFVVFILGFYIFDKLTPYHLWKELTEKKNVALAIVVGAVSIGISIIIASAING